MPKAKKAPTGSKLIHQKVVFSNKRISAQPVAAITSHQANLMNESLSAKTRQIERDFSVGVELAGRKG